MAALSDQQQPPGRQWSAVRLQLEELPTEALLLLPFRRDRYRIRLLHMRSRSGVSGRKPSLDKGTAPSELTMRLLTGQKKTELESKELH